MRACHTAAILTLVRTEAVRPLQPSDFAKLFSTIIVHERSPHLQLAMTHVEQLSTTNDSLFHTFCWMLDRRLLLLLQDENELEQR